MVIFKHTSQLSRHLLVMQEKEMKTGFVPTMGALHRGHISLIEKAVAESDLVVSSIFVNPTQFNDPADFEKYPITIEKDIDMLEKAGCDVLFMPTVNELYPEGLATQQHYDLGYLETILDGKYRPGHFQGVCRVVEKLLHIVHPDKLFLGQKDYQQCMVIKRLMELMQLKTSIVICPTEREPGGLAMSSRNMRLTEAERANAVAIYQALCFIQQHIKPGKLDDLKKLAANQIAAAGFKIDYIEIATAANLLVLQDWDGNTPLVALAAAYMNEVRLIDNLLL